MYSREIENKKKHLKLLEKQREILVGLILGDGHLETQNKGRTYRLKVEQCIEHAGYVNHLHEIFKDWVNSPPRVRLRSGKDGMNCEMIGFQTLSHASFRFYAQQFYSNGKKKIPKMINKLLTPKALAYWFMDDGSMKWRSSRAVIFNTQGYCHDEVEKLVSVLKSQFILDASLRKQKEGPQICIRGNSLERFVTLVGPYLLKEMWYKIPESGRTYLPKM